MRSLGRVQSAINTATAAATASRQSNLLCCTCKAYAGSSSRRLFASASHQRDQLSLSERIRKKLWATDEVPGRIDPYDPSSPFPETAERRREEALPPEEGLVENEEYYDESESKGPEIVDAPTLLETKKNKDYAPATSWDGLERLGGKKKRSQMGRYKGYVETS